MKPRSWRTSEPFFIGLCWLVVLIALVFAAGVGLGMAIK